VSDFAAFVPVEWTRAGLAAAGYEGFVTFAELRQTGATTRPGIYVVTRVPATPPRFLLTNPAGKRRDFTELVPILESEWIEGAEVVYIGLATHGARRDGIHRRLKQFRRTGAGTADNHSGGVWIFQLEDAANLQVCWRASEDESDEYIAVLEHHLIADFAARPEHGRRPFANRKD
jgi:hypothetical protein